MRHYTVYTEREPVRDAFAIWFFSTNQQGERLVAYPVGKDTWQDEVVPMDSYVEPTLRLPSQMFKDLIKSVQGQIEPEDATVDAMRDARDTRDRLLAMIERGWETVVNPRWIVGQPPEGGKEIG